MGDKIFIMEKKINIKFLVVFILSFILFNNCSLKKENTTISDFSYGIKFNKKWNNNAYYYFGGNLPDGKYPFKFKILVSTDDTTFFAYGECFNLDKKVYVLDLSLMIHHFKGKGYYVITNNDQIRLDGTRDINNISVSSSNFNGYLQINEFDWHNYKGSGLFYFEIPASNGTIYLSDGILRF